MARGQCRFLLVCSLLFEIGSLPHSGDHRLAKLPEQALRICLLLLPQCWLHMHTALLEFSQDTHLTENSPQPHEDTKNILNY